VAGDIALKYAVLEGRLAMAHTYICNLLHVAFFLLEKQGIVYDEKSLLS
jgi:hypothetical protein